MRKFVKGDRVRVRSFTALYDGEKGVVHSQGNTFVVVHLDFPKESYAFYPNELIRLKKKEPEYYWANLSSGGHLSIWKTEGAADIMASDFRTHKLKLRVISKTRCK